MKSFVCIFFCVIFLFLVAGCQDSVGSVIPETQKHAVTYDKNGATSGQVPIDSTEYQIGDIVTAKGNTGFLVRDSYAFAGWVSNLDGTGTSCAADGSGKLAKGSYDITLYAVWIPDALIAMAGGNAIAVTAASTAISGSINIPIGVTIVVDGAFRYCADITGVSLPKGLKDLGSGAFQGCSSLQSCVIPEGIMYIRPDTFRGCTAMTSVTFPDGVVYIGDYAFMGCPFIHSITLLKDLVFLGTGAFSDCSNLSRIDIPNGVTNISSQTFYNCSQLETVLLPFVSTIDSSAFERCSSLRFYFDTYRMKSIGSFAFSNCNQLTSFTINDGVTFIGDQAFNNCSQLNEIIARPINPPSLGNNVFSGIQSGYVIRVLDSNLSMYQDSEDWKNFNISGFQ